MLSNDTIIKVRNRDSGTVGYKINDSGVIRHFAPKETKEVTMGELRQLVYQSGGKFILTHYFVLNNQEAVEELVGHVEPEYFFTEKTVTEMLTSYERTSLLKLQDCLDFAPEGVIDMVKNLAVELEIPDVRKRDAIFKATGFNVSNAITIKQQIAEEDAANKPAATKARRVSDAATAPIEAAAAPVRRISIKKPSVEESTEE